jgi:hypothetical protein
LRFERLSGTRALSPESGVRFPASRIFLGIVLAALSSVPDFGQAKEKTSSYEYEVKAVFLYHFTRYLQWPDENEPEVFSLVVLGESEILGPLQEIAGKKTVGSKPLVVRTCSELEQIGRPRILFIAKSAVSKMARVLEKTRGTDILTVSEGESLGARGVAVNFVLRDGTVKFEMSEKVMKEAGIQISSQLLKLAILVDENKGSGGR